VVFTASADHDSAVSGYQLEIFAAGVSPTSAPALASTDLGKPMPDPSGEIAVDRSQFFNALLPGSYSATVSAIGPGGRGRSEVYAFTR
jgi:hypothetical protein